MWTRAGALALIPFVLLVCGVYGAESAWQSRLYVPTFIDKHDGNYVIVSCWQHRIIYSPRIDAPIGEWKSLDDSIAGPHSFACKGGWLLAEDTGRDALNLYEWSGADYVLRQRVEDVPRRPHRIRWDERTESFWVLAANNQKLYQLALSVDEEEPLALLSEFELPFLDGVYTRSFTIVDDLMYFVSGPGQVVEVSFGEGTVELTRTYRIPAVLGGAGGMNDVFRTSDGWWYFSSTATGALIRSRSLESLESGLYEDAKDALDLSGTPYYLAEFDGRIWVTLIYDENGVVSFRHGENESLVDAKLHFAFGPKMQVDGEREAHLPKALD